MTRSQDWSVLKPFEVSQGHAHPDLLKPAVPVIALSI